ncbi:hypothetical protein D3C73_1061450 [compost metagenome]
MAADVMAPPAVSGIRRTRRKVRLEPKRFPGDDGITGEADRIPVAAKSGIPREGERPLLLSAAIQIMIVVQHPERVEARYLSDTALLPVDPPEVHSLRFQRVMQELEIRLEKGRIGYIELHRIALFRVQPQLGGNRLIRFLEGPDTVCRMDIQRNMQPAFMQPGKKSWRVREEFPVPGVPRPAAAVLRIDIDQMPVHIQHRH